jgi:hypothetical protein
MIFRRMLWVLPVAAVSSVVVVNAFTSTTTTTMTMFMTGSYHNQQRVQVRQPTKMYMSVDPSIRISNVDTSATSSHQSTNTNTNTDNAKPQASPVFLLDAYATVPFISASTSYSFPSSKSIPATILPQENKPQPATETPTPLAVLDANDATADTVVRVPLFHMMQNTENQTPSSIPVVDVVAVQDKVTSKASPTLRDLMQEMNEKLAFEEDEEVMEDDDEVLPVAVTKTSIQTTAKTTPTRLDDDRSVVNDLFEIQDVFGIDSALTKSTTTTEVSVAENNINDAVVATAIPTTRNEASSLTDTAVITDSKELNSIPAATVSATIDQGRVGTFGRPTEDIVEVKRVAAADVSSAVTMLRKEQENRDLIDDNLAKERRRMIRMKEASRYNETPSSSAKEAETTLGAATTTLRTVDTDRSRTFGRSAAEIVEMKRVADISTAVNLLRKEQENRWNEAAPSSQSEETKQITASPLDVTIKAQSDETKSLITSGKPNIDAAKTLLSRARHEKDLEQRS